MTGAPVVNLIKLHFREFTDYWLASWRFFVLHFMGEREDWRFRHTAMGRGARGTGIDTRFYLCIL
jgi:hypothetical protein